jgi:hypothetical protein
MVVKFRKINCPLHRSSLFIEGLRCQAIKTEHGLYVYSRKKPKKQSMLCDVYVAYHIWHRFEFLKAVLPRYFSYGKKSNIDVG